MLKEWLNRIACLRGLPGEWAITMEQIEFL